MFCHFLCEEVGTLRRHLHVAVYDLFLRYIGGGAIRLTRGANVGSNDINISSQNMTFTRLLCGRA